MSTTRKPPCRRRECLRLRVSPEAAAVVAAADRFVAEWDWQKSRSDLFCLLKSAVYEARAVAYERDGYTEEAKDARFIAKKVARAVVGQERMP
jgi:hypothetical protein